MILQLNSGIPIVDLFLTLCLTATEHRHLTTNRDRFLFWLSVACFRTLPLISNNNCYLTAKGTQTHCRLLDIPTKRVNVRCLSAFSVVWMEIFFSNAIVWTGIKAKNIYYRKISVYVWMQPSSDNSAATCWWAPHLDYRSLTENEWKRCIFVAVLDPVWTQPYSSTLTWIHVHRRLQFSCIFIVFHCCTA